MYGSTYKVIQFRHVVTLDHMYNYKPGGVGIGYTTEIIGQYVKRITGRNQHDTFNHANPLPLTSFKNQFTCTDSALASIY